MTPSAMESPIVRREWRHARQHGVCVYPVKGAPDSELGFAKLPAWMRKAHFFDIEKEWEGFVQHLRSPCSAPRVAFMAPDLPEIFVPRPSEFAKLKSYLLNGSEPVAITTALSGAGGFGKTTLATALCHDEEVIEAFDDGILWVTLGQNPNLVAAVSTLYAALTGERPSFANLEDAGFQLSQRLQDLTCLLVVDDVWDADHLKPFLRGAKSCARLITTRDSDIAAQARRVDVDEMTEEESLKLLRAEIPEIGREQVRGLSRRLGDWPLALELARAMIRQRVDRGDQPAKAVQIIEQALGKRGIGVLRKDTADARHRTIDATLQVTLQVLSSDERERLAELSIFPEDVAIPLESAAAVWGVDEFEADGMAQSFAKLSLLKLDLQRGVIRLHDVLRSWLSGQVRGSAALHSRLVDAWPDWHALPNSYAWRWLTWHLARAGRTEDLQRICWDAAWLEAKLEATDVNSLIGDFEYFKPDPEAELIQGALALSAHVIGRDRNQLVPQLMGRLLDRTGRNLQRLFQEHRATSPMLKPLARYLFPPGTALLRTLAGHTDSVLAVAVYAEGRRAISASDDHTLKLWDLETGAELRTLAGHGGGFTAVAVYAEGRRAISASDDRTLKLWDLETGTELRTLAGHTGWVRAVAVYAEGRRAISASDDRTLKLWDLETGLELRTLAGHSAWISAVAVYAEGRRAISASYDQTLKLWDLETGAELRALAGHSSGVNAVAVYAEGRRAISASDDNTLKLWDLETGAAIATYTGEASMTCCEIASNTGIVVAGDSFGTMHFLRLEEPVERG
jgi:WD40 repeat protein